MGQLFCVRFYILRENALVELLGHRGHLHADAGLDVVAGGAGHGGRVHVGELGARRLLAEGVGVGDVVADHFEVLRSGAQAGQALLEAHGGLLGKSGTGSVEGATRISPGSILAFDGSSITFALPVILPGDAAVPFNTLLPAIMAGSDFGSGSVPSESIIIGIRVRLSSIL